MQVFLNVTLMSLIILFIRKIICDMPDASTHTDGGRLQQMHGYNPWKVTHELATVTGKLWKRGF